MKRETSDPKRSIQSAIEYDHFEFCESCEAETPHDVHIETQIESSKQENAEFSREPYRISVCTVCETESAVRMNNA